MKQVILVPMWLGMSPGKVASQCCHVAIPFSDDGVQKRIILRVEEASHMTTLRRLWQEVVRNTNEQEAPNWYAFVDSEPTTEGTAGKMTAVSITGPEASVDRITGHLELY